MSSGGNYSGDFKNGQFDGHGIFTWTDGQTYDGEFQNGKKSGKGVMTK